MLDREAIFAADDIEKTQVSAPEWGGHVWLQTMTGPERDAWEGLIGERGKGKQEGDPIDTAGLKTQSVILNARNEAGRLIFVPADFEALNKKSSVVIDRIFQAFQKLNKLTRDDVEDAAKNFQRGQNAGSGSA